MTTPTDTRRDLLTVIARMRAKPGKEQDAGGAGVPDRADRAGEGW